MQEDLISIIIPVYNVKTYLGNCVNSILEQTYTNLEVILINDCSNDGSEELCDKFLRKDTRVRVLNHIENSGAGVSRNSGIDVAKGKYIMFVDADDYIAHNCVEELYRLLLKSKSDISICKWKEVYDISRHVDVEKEKLGKYEIMSSKEAIENICYQRKINPGPCAKLYKISLFDDIRYPNTGYEDLAIIYKLIHKAKTVAFSPVEKYYYVQRKNNTTLGKFNEKKMDRILVAENMKKFVCEKYPDLLDAVQTRCFLAGIQTLYVLPKELLKSGYITPIKRSIKKYRNTVIKNKKAKMSIRIMAVSSYLGIRSLKFLGKLYSFSQGTVKLKLK